MPSVLDSTAYPHLLDLVFQHAPGPSLLRLRACSSASRDRADLLLAQHLVVRTDVVSPYGLNGWHPGLAFLRIKDDSQRYSNWPRGLKQLPEYDAAVRLLRITRIVDVEQQPCWFLAGALEQMLQGHTLEILRGRRVAGRGLSWTTLDLPGPGQAGTFNSVWQLLNLAAQCVIHRPGIGAPDPSSRNGTFSGQPLSLDTRPQGLTSRRSVRCRVASKIVYTITLQDLLEGIELGTYDYEEDAEIVVIFASRPEWTARPLLRDTDIFWNGMSSPPLHVPRRFTFVNCAGVPAGAFVPIDGGSEDKHPFERHVRNRFYDRMSRIPGWYEERFTFLTTKEYIERVGTEQYKLETEG